MTDRAPAAYFTFVVRVASVQSRCECQATLGADLDERRHVLRGWAVDARRGVRENAPAHSIGADASPFQVGWHCPLCTRNTLRSFDPMGLAYVSRGPEAPAG